MRDELCRAIEEENTAAVQRLLNECTDPNQLDSGKRLPLNIAVGSGNVQITQILLEASCLVNIPDGRGKFPLHEVALTNRAESGAIVELLLKAEADPNSLDFYQETPLMSACYWSNADVVELLAMRSSNVNYQTPSTHRAAIHYAAMRQDKELISVLLKHGGDPDLCDDDYETPLIIATRSKSIHAVEALLETNCSVDFQGFMDYTALHWAVYANNALVTDILLRNNAALDLVSCLDKLPLHVGASCGATECINLLLEAGADTEGVDSSGLTPLLTAIQGGYAPVVKLLLYSNANPNHCPISKHVPLVMAIEKTYTDIAKDLIFAGASLVSYWQNRESFTPNSGPLFFRHMAEGQRKLGDLVSNYICKVASLQHLCRINIRKSLSRSLKIISDIDNLKLPVSLKEFVAMKEILHEDNTLDSL